MCVSFYLCYISLLDCKSAISRTIYIDECKFTKLHGYRKVKKSLHVANNYKSILGAFQH
jgi:hypothetical protein